MCRVVYYQERRQNRQRHCKNEVSLAIVSLSPSLLFSSLHSLSLSLWCRCTLLSIDKLEFLHLLRHKNAIKSVLDSAEAYADVNNAIDGGNAAEGDGEDNSSLGDDKQPVTSTAASQRHPPQQTQTQNEHVPLAASTKSLRLLVSRATKKR